MPFILRGVNLLGVESVYASADLRATAWSRLASTLKPEHYAMIAGEEIGLSDLKDKAAEIIAGKIQGRTLVNPNK